MPETMLISKKECEWMKETRGLLQDPEMMWQVFERKQNIRKGKLRIEYE